jgi:Tfp pilus assembly protein PilF
MPYADPEDKRLQMKRWREKNIKNGYGKWLYARRKLRFDDAERFRTALTAITEISSMSYDNRAKVIARLALEESQKAEQELGEFIPSD